MTPAARVPGLALPAALFAAFLLIGFSNPLLRLLVFRDNIFPNYLRPLPGIVLSSAFLAGAFVAVSRRIRRWWPAAAVFGAATLVANYLGAGMHQLFGGPGLDPRWQPLVWEWFRGFALFGAVVLAASNAGVRFLPVLSAGLAGHCAFSLVRYCLIGSPGAILRLSWYTLLQLAANGLIFGALAWAGLRAQEARNDRSPAPAAQPALLTPDS